MPGVICGQEKGSIPTEFAKGFCQAIGGMYIWGSDFPPKKNGAFCHELAKS